MAGAVESTMKKKQYVVFINTFIESAFGIHGVLLIDHARLVGLQNSDLPQSLWLTGSRLALLVFKRAEHRFSISKLF